MKRNNQLLIQIDESHLKSLKDPFNANVEVFVTFKDGLTVTIIVGTPKNFEYLMSKDQVNFYGPGLPWIIVKELTVEIIYEAIQGYMNDSPNGYWLKLYHFWNEVDNTIFNALDPLELDESTQLNLCIKLDQLKTELNKSLKLLEDLKLNSEKSKSMPLSDALLK